MSDTPAPISASTPRRRWTAPVIHDLPRLTDLTLQTPPSTMNHPRLQPGVFRLGDPGVPV